MIIIDSNIWIFSEIKESDEYALANEKKNRALETRNLGINIIIASETYHFLARTFGADEARRRLNSIITHPYIHWLEFSADMTGRAIGLAAEADIRINDALIARQALETGAAVLTDNVKHLKKVEGLKIIPLR